MSLHVLIVDDSPSLRRMIERSLTANGFAVSAVGLAAEALRIAEGEQVDVVVTDLNMPEMDGLALTRRLRSISCTTISTATNTFCVVTPTDAKCRR